MTDDERQEEQLEARPWTYTGRYGMTKGLGSQWIDHRGETVRFGRVPKGAVVGGRYLVRCLADSSSAVIIDAEYQGPTGESPETVAQWRLDDKREYLHDEARKAVDRAKRENGDLGQLTLEQVRQQLLRAGGLRRGALLAAVLGYIEGGPL